MDSIFWDVTPYSPLKEIQLDIHSLIEAYVLRYSFSGPQDGGDMLLRNVC
jgi:hypothetical protein